MPLMKYLAGGKKSRRTVRSSRLGRKKKEKVLSLSKTREWGQAIDSEHLSELTEEEEVSFTQSKLVGFARLDRKYFTPFFTRRFTHQELHDCKSQMADLTNKWYQAIRISPDDLDEEDDEDGDAVSIAASDRSTNNLVDGGSAARGKQSSATTASAGGPSRAKS